MSTPFLLLILGIVRKKILESGQAILEKYGFTHPLSIIKPSTNNL